MQVSINKVLKRNMMDQKNHNGSTDATDMHSTDADRAENASVATKLRAFIAGLTPTAVFKLTLASSVVIALAATIIWHTATDTLHVNVNKIETATVVLSGSQDLGGIEAGGYLPLSYSIKNQSTKPSYIFIRIQMATPRLYEVVDTGWCEVEAAEGDNEIILAYGESGGLTPVGIGEEVVFIGRLHCLAGAVEYSELTGADMDIDVEGCLVWGIGVLITPNLQPSIQEPC